MANWYTFGCGLYTPTSSTERISSSKDPTSGF
jgi:hypothetical protein